MNPLLESPDEGRDEVELASHAGRWFLILFPGRQVANPEPGNLGNLLAGLGLKVGLVTDTGYNVQPDLLLAHGEIEIVLTVDRKEGGTVVSSLFYDLANGTFPLGLVLVDLALGETP